MAEDVLIIGCGAIGGVTAARLHKAGHRITVVDKNTALVAAVEREGVRIQHVDDSLETAYIPITVVPPERKFSTVLVAVKQYDSRDALTLATAHCEPNGLVVLLQNGINIDLAAEQVPDGNLCSAVIVWACVNEGRGSYRMTSKSCEFYVGYRSGGSDDRLVTLSTLLSDVWPCHISNNIYGHLWSKLIVNCFVNPTCAIFDLSIGDMLRDPAFLPICYDLIAEIVAVAEAEGVVLEKLKERIDFSSLAEPLYLQELRRRKRLPRLWRWIAKALWSPHVYFRRYVFAQVAKHHDRVRSSMWQDIHRGNPTEIDAINGYVVARGKVHGLDCKVNAAIVSLVKERERTGLLTREHILACLSN